MELRVRVGLAVQLAMKLAVELELVVVPVAVPLALELAVELAVEMELLVVELFVKQWCCWQGQGQDGPAAQGPSAQALYRANVEAEAELPKEAEKEEDQDGGVEEAAEEMADLVASMDANVLCSGLADKIGSAKSFAEMLRGQCVGIGNERLTAHGSQIQRLCAMLSRQLAHALQATGEVEAMFASDEALETVAGEVGNPILVPTLLALVGRFILLPPLPPACE